MILRLTLNSAAKFGLGIAVLFILHELGWPLPKFVEFLCNDTLCWRKHGITDLWGIIELHYGSVETFSVNLNKKYFQRLYGPKCNIANMRARVF